MIAIKESEINQELVSSEEFKTFFVKNWLVGKQLLEVITKAVKRPLLHLAIKVLIDLGDRLYVKKSKEININLN